MFWIFKIFPDWIWWLLLIIGLSGYFLTQLFPLKSYTLLLKILAAGVASAAIFILGMLHANNTWQAAAQELQTKVAALEAQSQQVNEVVKERLVTRTQVVRVRGDEVVKYIDREVAKTNAGCVISPEFVSAHNLAAEPPK
jgi:uncharacterized membrane protein